MQDATGQPICQYDLLMFQTTGGAHDGRGLAVKALPGKKVSVLCVDGTEVAKKACDVTVVDRSFSGVGMAVALVSDPGGQIGVITGATTELDLVQLHGGKRKPTVVAAGVSPALVRPVKELTLGDYVVLSGGAWLGRVIEVSVVVDVVFDDDRSVCRVTQAGDKLGFLRNRSGFWSGDKSGFSPGDRVAGDASVFKASRWLKGHWNPSRVEGTVAKVEMGGVLVYWVAHAGGVPGSPPPAYQVDPSNLTFFCSGSSADHKWYWGVSARCFFRCPPNHSSLATSERPKKKKWRRRVELNKGEEAAAAIGWEPLESPMAIADTRTTVDVLWQDGTRQRGMPSASLLHVLLLNDQDFLPGQRVIGNTTADSNASGHVGVVKSLSYKDQTVRVSWITDEPAAAVESDTVMSTYALDRSSNHNLFYGDIVIRLRPRESAVEAPAAAINKNDDIPWVGHVVDLCHTQFIHVLWGDGNTSKVLPHEIAFVKRQPSFDEMLKEMGDWVHVEDGDGDIGETQEDVPLLQHNDTDGHGGGDDDSDGLVLGQTAIGRVGNIIQVVIRTASRMLAQLAERYWLSGSAIAPELRAEPPATIDNIQTGGNDHCHMKEVGAAAETLASPGSGDDVYHFQQFDVVQSSQDHHYLDNKEQDRRGGRDWLKRVQKEWKILETSLPDTIYVRAFEDRMDLLRAVIVGASGTPYQDGLFFFDMRLPPSYPTTPPQVKYHSFGLRVNPNLYPSGTVCLSLLGTFGGVGPELWSPEMSSILQVVVSIQGLVLTAQPYYNEAGYAQQVGTPEGHRNELPYCENTYLVNLHTMLNLIRRPPVGFEAFIKDHFRHRGGHILRACEAYLQEACCVATLDGEACPTEESRERSCSKGFRLALANVVPRLVEAFAGIDPRVGYV